MDDLSTITDSCTHRHFHFFCFRPDYVTYVGASSRKHLRNLVIRPTSTSRTFPNFVRKKKCIRSSRLGICDLCFCGAIKSGTVENRCRRKYSGWGSRLLLALGQRLLSQIASGQNEKTMTVRKRSLSIFFFFSGLIICSEITCYIRIPSI